MTRTSIRALREQVFQFRTKLCNWPPEWHVVIIYPSSLFKKVKTHSADNSDSLQWAPNGHRLSGLTEASRLDDSGDASLLVLYWQHEFVLKSTWRVFGACEDDRWVRFLSRARKKRTFWGGSKSALCYWQELHLRKEILMAMHILSLSVGAFTFPPCPSMHNTSCSMQEEEEKKNVPRVLLRQWRAHVKPFRDRKSFPPLRGKTPPGYRTGAAVGEARGQSHSYLKWQYMKNIQEEEYWNKNEATASHELHKRGQFHEGLHASIYFFFLGEDGRWPLIDECTAAVWSDKRAHGWKNQLSFGPPSWGMNWHFFCRLWLIKSNHVWSAHRTAF